MSDKVNNPFKSNTPTVTQSSHAANIEKNIQEIQAALVVAQSRPRNEIQAMDKILSACQRQTLAEEAFYCYQRGGTEITGPTIRLAEAMAQYWGNMEFGFRELSNENNRSEVGAFAWDWETNTRRSLTFFVSHTRHTKNGSYVLTDSRDIYEMVANQAQRRVRACILALLPGDVVDAACNQCQQTLEKTVKVDQKAIKEMMSIFEKNYGVTQQMIEERLGRRIESITSPQMINLKNIHHSLRDGMSKPSQWFSIPDNSEMEESKKANISEHYKSVPKNNNEEIAIENKEEPKQSVEQQKTAVDQQIDKMKESIKESRVDDKALPPTVEGAFTHKN